MSLKKLFKNLFSPDEITLNRRRKRKEHKAIQNITYDMPAFYSSDFNDKFDIDLYTIAFNSVKLIEYQIKFLRKFIKSKFIYIVVDNSKIKEESEKIRELCQRENISYFRVFKAKKIRGTYSASHAMALNWAYAKLIKQRKSNFAFIDHDIFPTCEENVYGYIKDLGLFGDLRNGYKDKNIYFLWAGFAFFNWNLVKDKNLDFGRLSNFWGKHIADSGSSNWQVIYKYYDRKLIAPVNMERYNVYTKTFNPENETDSRRTCVEYLFNRKWLHLVAGSAWYEIGDKNDYAFKILDSLLAS